ncbi:MAG TPA: carbohydrate porin [Woeseiaceae bacterium]|nr:carbohydrate porin [Woeseiaceae bacterium]
MPLLCLASLAGGGAALAEGRGAGPPPVTIEAAYTADFLANVSGGREEGSAHLDNLDMVIEGDLERLLGWSDSRFVLYGLYNNGRCFSERYVGDAQVVSNIETGIEALRLFEAYVETGLGDDGSVLFGLYDLNSEFDALEASGLFLNSAHGIGTDIGQTGEAGPSIFPVTSLALRLAWQWNERWRTRLAVLDAVPGVPDDPDRTAVDLGESQGFLLVGELERTWRNARVLAGAWRYTAAFEDHRAHAGTTIEARGNHGAYLRGEWRPGGGNPALFGRLGWAAPRFNAFEWFASAGAVWEDAPGGGQLGVALALAESSEPFREKRLASGARPDPREIALELTYAVTVTEWLSLQPGLHYVIDPGLDPSLGNALVAGLRVTLTFL